MLSYKKKSIHLGKLIKVLSSKFDFKTFRYSAIDILKKGILMPLHKEMAHVETHKRNKGACDHSKNKGRGGSIHFRVNQFLSDTFNEGGSELDEHFDELSSEHLSEDEDVEEESFVAKGLAPALKNTFVCSNEHEWVEDSQTFGISV